MADRYRLEQSCQWLIEHDFQKQTAAKFETMYTFSPHILRTIGLFMQYDWVQNLQAIFGSAGVDDIEGDEPILLITPLYFQNLSSALQGVNLT